ncbi:cytochrome c2 [Rhizobium sp. BK181]|nr:cytochrome c2 [Rhizobium sp. BK181]
MPLGLMSYRLAAITGMVAAVLLVGYLTNAFKEQSKRQTIAEALTGGDSTLALPIFRRYGCGGCHTISGVPGADGKVGAPLEQLSQQVYIGGVINNTPDNLTAWIVSPQRFSPQSAMPATGVTEAEARHLSAYLYGK